MAKNQTTVQMNHQVLGCVRPFIAPFESSTNAAVCTAATGIANARPRGVMSDSPASRASPATSVNAGFVQPNASPV